MMINKRSRCRVYFNEYNPLIGNAAYLPLTSGKLQAYAMTSEEIKRHYEFMPYLFHIDSLDNVLSHYEDPGVAAFSAAIWNEQLCLHAADRIKRRWPDCLIIFGGTQVPHHPVEYMQQYRFIDVAVRGEGEGPFKEVLQRYMSSRDFGGIPGVTWRSTASGEVEFNPDSSAFEKDLDVYPSPYLDGLYEDMLHSNDAFRFQAIIETNRGCPFACTFCYWGKGGLSRKYRFFSVERAAAELEWIGKNGIYFVYNADSNFGMHRRDEEIADVLVATKRKYGSPEKVVNLYGKNTDHRIYNIAKRLYQNGMHKGLGLSRQSMSPEALTQSKRSNIKMSVYKSLQEKFEADGIPTFCELIIGLPGETYDSFAAGISELLEASLSCQLIIVLCEIYPNTEMGDPAYQKKYGIRSKRNVSYGVHSVVQDERWVTEYIDYVIATESMPLEEWKRTGILTWTTMTLTSFRLGYYLLLYLQHRFGTRHIDFIQFMAEGRMKEGTGSIWRDELRHYEAFMNQIMEGRGRAVVLPEFGNIYWAIEEASFLRITDRAEQFYREMFDIAVQFLTSKGIAFEEEELNEALLYQRMCIPTPRPFFQTEHVFQYNFPEFFEDLSSRKAATLRREPQHLVVDEKDFELGKLRFAQERLLWGRRGGKFERAVRWQSVGTEILVPSGL